MKCRYCGEIVTHYDMGHDCQARKDAMERKRKNALARKSISVKKLKTAIQRMVDDEEITQSQAVLIEDRLIVNS